MRTFNILNLGAGVQSTTLYLMSVAQDEPEHVPVFDYAIFADTQEEPQAVYEHLEWLKSLNGPPIIVATAGKLGDDLVLGVNAAGQRFSSIPAYCKGEGDTREGHTRRQCTRDYKVDVVERVIRRQLLGLVLRQHMPKDVRVIQYLGLSFDEPRRVAKVRARYDTIAWAEPRFPLFDLEWDRASCRSYLAEKVPHRVPRSACVFCPYKANPEWADLRDNDAAGWARAIEIDSAIRAHALCNSGFNKKLYLHRSCVPLAEAVIDTPEPRSVVYFDGMAQECEGMCGL